MSEQTNFFDLNTADQQREYDPIPAGTEVALQMIVRPGGVGEGGWLKASKDGASQHIDAEFIVVSPEKYAKRKVWQRITVQGTTAGHAEAVQISQRLVRAIVESARGIRPDDTSEAAQAARRMKSWGDLNNLRFVAKLGIEPAQGTFAAKNNILEAITPDKKAWSKQEQSPAPAPTSASPAAAPPAGAIVRPEWGQKVS